MDSAHGTLSRPTDEGVLTRQEAELARKAAAGDGAAFATLYDRYEQRIFNYCNRLLSSQDDAADATQDAFVKVLQRLPKLQDRELNFSAYLYTAARNASYDMIGRRKRAEPTEDIAEMAAGGAVGMETAALELDPERNAMLSAQQADVRSANARLPERQREVLALRELQEMSYDEIAEVMGMNRNSVAQLISRARIKLRDELRGTAVAAIAASSPDCERALPLLAMAGDGQLGEGDDRDFLDGHVASCDTCRVAREAMEEAGASYRAWLPLIPLWWLKNATIARAAETMGHDWSEHQVHEADGNGANGNGADGGGANGHALAAAGAGAGGAAAGASAEAQADALHLVRRRRLRRAGLTGVAAIVLALVIAAVTLGGDRTIEPKLADPVAVVDTNTPAGVTQAAAGHGVKVVKQKGKATLPGGEDVSVVDPSIFEVAGTPASTGSGRSLSTHKKTASKAKKHRSGSSTGGSTGDGHGNLGTGGGSTGLPNDKPVVNKPVTPSNPGPATTPAPVSSPTPVPVATPTPPPATTPSTGGCNPATGAGCTSGGGGGSNPSTGGGSTPTTPPCRPGIRPVC
jgi:RNA polymerase sigma-70 factor (ECF subfamily)